MFPVGIEIAGQMFGQQNELAAAGGFKDLRQMLARSGRAELPVLRCPSGMRMCCRCEDHRHPEQANQQSGHEGGFLKNPVQPG